MIVFWGVMAVLCGAVNSYDQLLGARFLLGVAEGGIWPAMLVLISHWFPVRERARAYSFWMANLAISSIVTQPLSGWIVSVADWRALFYIEGSLPFLIALPLWLIFVKDRPSQASWCSAGERKYIETSLARDDAQQPTYVPFFRIFATPMVWRLVAVYFLIQVGFYGAEHVDALPAQASDRSGLRCGRTGRRPPLSRRDRPDVVQRRACRPERQVFPARADPHDVGSGEPGAIRADRTVGDVVVRLAPLPGDERCSLL
jgi:MFS family permease